MSTKSGGDTDPINEEYTGSVTEVGAQAVWSLSSCKPGNFLAFFIAFFIPIYNYFVYVSLSTQRIWC